jgi:hypothetical protein
MRCLTEPQTQCFYEREPFKKTQCRGIILEELIVGTFSVQKLTITKQNY